MAGTTATCGSRSQKKREEVGTFMTTPLYFLGLAMLVTGSELGYDYFGIIDVFRDCASYWTVVNNGCASIICPAQQSSWTWKSD
jgi:hypothetical protein